VRYRIRLVSATRYEAPAPRGAHVLRVRPRDDPRQQVHAFVVETEPAAPIAIGRDFFGNDTHTLVVDRPHSQFTFRVTAEVERAEGMWLPETMTPPWEDVRRAAWTTSDIGPRSPAHFLYPGRIARPDADITAYAAASFPAGVAILDGALDLMQRIHRDFTYDADATDVTTTPAAAFVARRGVCQDYAHVMIAGLRGIGLPAAYVSGFLRTAPAPGMPRLEGADATHAWVSVWCGPEGGWVDLDPTNALVADVSHVTIGIGRDYADIAPETGVIITAGRQTLEVAVDMTPLA
jgi:transglutaminase-like putative cysteine protease